MCFFENTSIKQLILHFSDNKIVNDLDINHILSYFKLLRLNNNIKNFLCNNKFTKLVNSSALIDDK